MWAEPGVLGTSGYPPPKKAAGDKVGLEEEVPLAVISPQQAPSSAASTAMEGICFEVKPTRDEALVPHCVQKPPSKRRSLPSIAPPTVVSSRLDKGRRSYPRARKETKEVPAEKEEEQEMRYRLALVGSLPVHPLTTMAMLPWVVAQIVRPGPGEREWGRGGPHVDGHQNPPKRNQSVFLTVSASRVQCVSAWAEGSAWDPLSHTVLFECLPHRVTKLIYNSQEPSSFGCLIRDSQHCACYVFQCHDSTRALDALVFTLIFPLDRELDLISGQS
ncbi:unnamed protein product [Boreogadus saida]